MTAAVEKSILVRVSRTCYSDDVKTVDDIGENGYDLEQLFASSSRQFFHSDPPVYTWSDSDWFIIEPSSDDSGVLKISEIFGVLPQDQPPVTVSEPASALVGSTLYEFGGSFRRSWEFYRGVRCLDIQNQSDGWKFCGNLDFRFQGDRAAVFNQYIYMFGPVVCAGKSHFAYVHDTIKQQGYLVKAPPEFIKNPIVEVWAPLEGHGMLFSFPRQYNGNFYLHDPALNSWKFCQDYEPLPLLTRGSICSRPGPSSVLNGILYILDRSCFLHSYDCKKGKLLYTIKLPPLYSRSNTHTLDFSPSYYPIRMVAVSDSILYVIGHCHSSLFCARVLVSSDPAPSAELLGVQCFGRGRILSVLNCVPVDASVALIVKNRTRPAVGARLGRVVKNPVPLDASFGRIVKGPMLLDETREDPKLSEDVGLKTRISKKSLNSRLPMFPVSKRMLHQPQTKKLKKLKLKLSSTPMNPPPSDSTNQSEDDGVRIVHIPVEMKLKRHQEDMTDLGPDSSSEGQG